MGKQKHLSDVEKFTLSQLGESCGWAEVLRAIGQHIAHEASDVGLGDAVRSTLCLVAKQVQQMESRF